MPRYSYGLEPHLRLTSVKLRVKKLCWYRVTTTITLHASFFFFLLMRWMVSSDFPVHSSYIDTFSFLRNCISICFLIRRRWNQRTYLFRYVYCKCYMIHFYPPVFLPHSKRSIADTNPVLCTVEDRAILQSSYDTLPFRHRHSFSCNTNVVTYLLNSLLINIGNIDNKRHHCSVPILVLMLLSFSFQIPLITIYVGCRIVTSNWVKTIRINVLTIN